jgi:hypothetical protein
MAAATPSGPPRWVSIVHRAEGWTPDDNPEYAALAVRAMLVPLKGSGQVFN